MIGRASFFLPMLSPLFLSSPNCREEVELFVGRERALGRDDMILPVYLVDSPKLEKAEERDKDPVATRDRQAPALRLARERLAGAGRSRRRARRC